MGKIKKATEAINRQIKILVKYLRLYLMIQ